MNSLASCSIFKRHLKLAVFSTALVCIAAPASYAGFEWIPASEAQVEKGASAVSAPDVVKAPMPEQTELSAPASVVSPAPAKMKVKKVHVKGNDMLPLPGADKKSEPVMKVKNFYAEESEDAQVAVSEPVPIATLSAEDSVAAPVIQEPIELQKSPQDVVVKRNVVIPDDAPESAVIKISKDGGDLNAAPEIKKEVIVEAVVTKRKVAVEKTVIVERKPEGVLEFAGAPVIGFGTDMPLALALNQIVPSGYAYAFGDGVNPGYRVSWSGGKSWVDVVSEMVKPLKLSSEVRGKTVYIRAEEEKAAALVPVSEEVAVDDVAELKAVVDDGARKNVVDPGESAAAQPVETVDALESKVRNDVVVVADTLVWEARKGDSLKDTLDGWSKVSNVDLIWEADYDYRLKVDVSTSGAFENALNMIVGFALEGDSVPVVHLLDAHQDAQQPAQLIIQDQSKG